uniref:Uncharacterized protein n=1 Tax=Syphacia muris TaxID=451379 RepID=A0A0N5AD76_9BILA
MRRVDRRSAAVKQALLTYDGAQLHSLILDQRPLKHAPVDYIYIASPYYNTQFNVDANIVVVYRIRFT